ncbi:YbiR family transporter [Lacrimispora xylanisolvens]|uniref:YbiR family transporter n=1 Tax=Lacrimispora xylanisolvens TaxID=384636 RepID=A0A2S6HX50_9FIRM|nr:SLC13 family permease [Hungatella xylanolytica]MBE5989115.1 citrate transporter [Paenibacillaceae bacterium]PPK82579.1 YbiR family transporter [Hungatella xylanolytica]
MKQPILFIQKEPVLTAASILAFISVFFIPPDLAYLNYIDFKTLLCLFCLMTSLKGIEREGLLNAVSIKLSSGMKDLKPLILLLVFTSFFASMFMTNDVALIALVPITLSVLSLCGQERHTALVVVLQTIAANIGSSFTPIGNPQNLYLFTRYEFGLPSFLKVTFPFVLFGGVLLLLVCFFIPRYPINQETTTVPVIRKKQVIAYGTMFLLAVAAVLRLVPYQAAALIILAATAILDRRTLYQVDYFLLLTFAAIFIFVGNLARIDWVFQTVSGLIRKDTMVTAALLSQFISNVPAAVMLSGFTDNAPSLLTGVNVGGMGTLIASMASVISYKLFTAAYPKKTLSFLGIFTVLNLVFLIALLLFEAVLM